MISQLLIKILLTILSGIGYAFLLFLIMVALTFFARKVLLKYKKNKNQNNYDPTNSRFSKRA